MSMSPLDFAGIEEFVSPNEAKVSGKKLKNTPIRIFGEDGEYQILSYYSSESGGCMILDIEPVDEE